MIRYKLTANNFKVYEVQKFESRPFYLDLYMQGRIKTAEPEQDQLNLGDEYKYTRFILYKRDFTTFDAINRIARGLGVSKKRFKCAGNKDKHAETIQMCSVFGIPPDKLLGLNLKDIKILFAVRSNEGIHMGELLGNKFEIHLNKIFDSTDEGKELMFKAVENFRTILKRGYIPNYFGYQRFGIPRKNTFIIGLKILQGNFESAVEEILTNSDGESNPSIIETRNKLKESKNYAEAYNLFPKYMRIERTILQYLQHNPTDCINALRKIPKTILLMYIHAVQSLIFNIQLYDSILKNGYEKNAHSNLCEYCCGETFGFPDVNKINGETKEDVRKCECKTNEWPVGKLIGYETETIDADEKMLAKLGIVKEHFRIRRLPEISSKGTNRLLFVPVINGDIKEGEDIRITFTLPKGSYATVVLDEIFENKPFLGK